MLNDLITGPLSQEQTALLAYQIAVEIADNENTYFIEKVISALPVDANEEVTKRRDKLC